MANLFRFLQHGYAPDVYDEYLVTKKISTKTTSEIHQNIREILADHTGNKFKIGKTGNAEVRVDMDDYRSSNFDKMFLLYEHSNPDIISNLEAYFIQTFKASYPRRCSNIHLHSGGKMYSETGYYYLYIVT